MAAGANLVPPSVQAGAAPIAEDDPAQAPGAVAAPGVPPLSGAAPAPGAPLTPPAAAPGAKPQIQTGPATPPQYDPQKLSKAQTPLDLLNAMRPKSRSSYMDWWEQQHGDINQRYDALKAQLGERPADDQPQSKKEKLAELLQFGLHLMKNSAQPTSNQGAVLTGTLADTIDSAQQQHQAAIGQQQQQYDAKANAIENARAADLKGIGTPAQAQAQQTKNDLADATELKDTGAALKDVTQANSPSAAILGPPTYVTGKDGSLGTIVRDGSGKAHVEPVTGIDGKPFSGRVLGRSAGSGIEHGDTAQIRNERYLQGVLGLDPSTAATVAFHAKTGNANADHMSIYRSVMSATMGDQGKAKRAADQYILDNYGAAGLAGMNQPLVPDVPPPAVLAGLRPGVVRDFGSKGAWTIGIDGKPKRVNRTPAPR